MLKSTILKKGSRENKKLSLIMAIIFLFTMFSFTIPVGAANISANINWSLLTRKTATDYTYALNIYKGHENSYATNQSYKDSVTYMKAGILRIHRAQMMQDSSSNNAGWVKNPTNSNYAWDTAKIDTVLNNIVPLAGTIMLNIVNWPAYMDDGTGKLKTDMYDEYAEFCASLLNYVKSKSYFSKIKYWEITNEKDSKYDGNCGELAKVYNAVATRLRQIDSTIKIGGPAFTWYHKTVNNDAFIGAAYQQLDFVSYHTYPSGSTSDSNAKVWDSAQNMGSATNAMRTSINKFTTKSIELFHDEYNISWNPPDSKMTSSVGMVFDALSMIAIANAGATGSMAWNECDGWYGKVNSDTNFTKRPAAHLYKVYNDDMKGNIVSSSTSDKTQLDIMAVKSGTWKKFTLINRSGADKTVQLSFSGWTNIPSSFTVKKMTGSGLAYSTADYAALTGTGGYTVPANSVIVFVCDDSGSATPTPTPTATPTPTPTPVPVGTSIRVNAGGSSYTDGAGNAWSPDQQYTSGSWGYVPVSSTSSLTSSTENAIANTTDDPLYQVTRYDKQGNLEYRFTVPNGSYKITLKFSENYTWASNGYRVFNIQLESATVLSNFDIYASAGGKNKAIDKSYTVNVSDGLLNVVLVKVTQNPSVAAIEVVQQ